MNEKIYLEASEWLVEFRGGRPDRATRGRFERWLCSSPEHVRAYLEQSAIWETLHSQPHADSPELQALIERARQALLPNVVSISSMKTPTVAVADEPQRQLRSRRRMGLAAAATLLLAVAGASFYLQAPRNSYSTATGEQRSILLPDGSTIDLNARSRVRVRFDRAGRHIDLVEGQALFRVAKDATRPFIVAVNGTQVRAVGTQFDINQRRHQLVVTVVEGTVAVSGAAAPNRVGVPPAPQILLDAGEQLTLTPAAPAVKAVKAQPSPQPVDVESATAWTHRRLVFDTTPLEDVAAEFNRNSERPIVVEGRGLDDFHVSGAFSSTDVQSFLRFMRAQTGVDVIEEADRIVITHR